MISVPDLWSTNHFELMQKHNRNRKQLMLRRFRERLTELVSRLSPLWESVSLVTELLFSTISYGLEYWGTPFVSAHVQTDGKRHELHTCLPLAWRPREGRLQHRRLVRGEELGVGAGLPLQPRLRFPERSRLLWAIPRRRASRYSRQGHEARAEKLFFAAGWVVRGRAWLNSNEELSLAQLFAGVESEGLHTSVKFRFTNLHFTRYSLSVSGVLPTDIGDEGTSCNEYRRCSSCFLSWYNEI